MRGLKIIGKKIILRPLEISDAGDITFNIQDKRIAEMISDMPWPYRLKDAQNFIKKMRIARRKKSDFVFGIKLKDKKEIIGCIGLHKVNFEHKNAELGFWLGSKYWNRGIMTEAGRLILNFAFSRLKLHRVWSGAFSDNFTSQRVFEKLGFKKEGIHRQDTWRFGRWKDHIYYGLLSDEFRENTKSRLRRLT